MPKEMTSFLASTDVIVDMRATCKRSVLRQLSAHAAKSAPVSEAALLESLSTREQLGTTGIGHGVAVPHARIGIPQMRGIFARLDEPVDFDAIDEQPVDLVFMLLAPQQSEADHLKALSRIARLFRTPGKIAAMRGAVDREALFNIAVSAADAQAA